MDEVMHVDPLGAALACARMGTLELRPNTVIMLMGLPGSGKSTAAKKLHETYGFTTLGSEAVTQALYDTLEGLEPESYVYASYIYRCAARLLVQQGHALVLDCPHLMRSRRNEMRSMLQDIVAVRLVHIACDPALAAERALSRASQIDEIDPRFSISHERSEFFRRKYEAPGENEDVITVISDETLDEQLDRLVTSIRV